MAKRNSFVPTNDETVKEPETELTPASEPDQVESPADPNGEEEASASLPSTTPGDEIFGGGDETAPLAEEGSTDLPAAEDGTAPAVDEPAPAAEGSDLPLGEQSAPSDAFPASEEIEGQADATAPVEAEGSDPLAQAPASSSETGSSVDGNASEEKPEAQAGSEEKGLGATHDGTDTPEVLKSNPVDPVTGRPLDGSGFGGNGYVTAGHGGAAEANQGQVPAHMIGKPSQDDSTDADSSQADAGDDDLSLGDDLEGDFEDVDSCEGEGLSGITAKLYAVQELIGSLAAELDGFEEA